MSYPARSTVTANESAVTRSGASAESGTGRRPSRAAAQQVGTTGLVDGLDRQAGEELVGERARVHEAGVQDGRQPERGQLQVPVAGQPAHLLLPIGACDPRCTSAGQQPSPGRLPAPGRQAAPKQRLDHRGRRRPRRRRDHPGFGVDRRLGSASGATCRAPSTERRSTGTRCRGACGRMRLKMRRRSCSSVRLRSIRPRMDQD